LFYGGVYRISPLIAPEVVALMSRRLSLKTLCATHHILIALFVLPGPESLQAQERLPAKTRTVPTLESLPHAALPRGVFKGWCGQKDRYLLDVDGQIEAHDAGVKYATIAVSSDWPWQCSDNGEQLVYTNTRMGYVTRVDIASGDSRLLASYQRPERENTTISFSPDLGSVATNIPLKITADAGKLKVILVQQDNQRNSKESVQQIRWSRDASRLAVAYDSTLVEILDSGGKRVGSGEGPKAWNVDDGWFDVDREALTLFLVPEQQYTGIAVRCDLVSWKCRRLKSRVDSFSIGGRGIMGAVAPLGKASVPDDDSIEFPHHYAAEDRHQGFGLLARQIYATAGGRLRYAISVSPSGTQAVLTWSNERLAGCGTGPDSVKCAQGILINLSKVLK
jgi:hypothetical protein